jgi:hypothetical protein
MDSCRSDTIGGFNVFLAEQDPETTININLFDHEYNELYSGSVKDAQKMSMETFVPRGNTALFDAIGKTIKKAIGTPIIVILTDGEENSSKEYTQTHIKDLIEEKTKQGWSFVFLGANQDAIMAAKNFGMSPLSAMTFSPDNVGVALKSASSAIKRGITSRSSGTPVAVEFSQSEREESVASN